MRSKDIKKDKEDESGIKKRGVYLLPNLLTTAALFAGFYAIVAAMNGKSYDYAAIAIFVAMIADGLDGRVARLTHTQTVFGAQYDSLSDMVAFGIAPALLIYSWSLFTLEKFGWLAAFIYAAATALRLARFNAQTSDADKTSFQGLPSPSGAAIIASIVWIGSNYEVDGINLARPLWVVTILVAALMVSTIRYSNFKSVDFSGRVSFFTAVAVVFILAAIALQPAEMLFTLFLVYIVSGPFFTLIKLNKVRKYRKLK